MNAAARLSLAVAALGFVAACAKQAPPPGGPEDRVAPALQSVDPPEGTVNVGISQPVRMVFTKSMGKEEVEQALHFFPPPASPPDLHWQGRALVVTPDTAWDSGQTYVVTLQSEARDVRGNSLGTTFQTAFSTGPQIDSGRIDGQVQSDGHPAPGVMVLCYRLPGERLNPEADTADYVVQTDSSGRFAFDFLGPGLYRIFGLDDRDRDWLWNIGSEGLAVPALDVPLDSGLESFPLPALHLAPLDTLIPSLVNCQRLSGTWIRLDFDGLLDSTILDSVSVWLKGESDTLAASVLLAPDSTNEAVFANFPELPLVEGPRDLIWRRTQGEGPGEVCAIDLSASGDSAVALEWTRIRPDTTLPWPAWPDRISLWFDRPLDSVQAGYFLTLPGPDSLGARLAGPFEVVIPLAPDLFGADTVRLAVAPGAVWGPGGSGWPAGDSIYLRLPVVPTDSSGSCEIQLDGVPGPAGQTLRATLRSLDRPAVDIHCDVGVNGGWTGVLAQGEYSLSILADRDGNGRWSAGWPSPFVPSERVWFPQDTLSVRARFTTEFGVSLVRSGEQQAPSGR